MRSSLTKFATALFASLGEGSTSILRSFASSAKEGASELPKIKPSPYMVFFGEKMKELKDGKKVALLWKALDDGGRQAYVDRASAIAKRLDEAYPNGIPKVRRRNSFPEHFPRSALNLFVQREMKQLKTAKADFKPSTGTPAPQHLKDMVARYNGLSDADRQALQRDVDLMKAQYVKERQTAKEKARAEREAEKKAREERRAAKKQ